MIRRTAEADFDIIWEIVNDGAQAYKGIIPADCWHEPYMTKGSSAARSALASPRRSEASVRNCLHIYVNAPAVPCSSAHGPRPFGPSASTGNTVSGKSPGKRKSACSAFTGPYPSARSKPQSVSRTRSGSRSRARQTNSGVVISGPENPPEFGKCLEPDHLEEVIRDQKEHN